MKVLNLALTIIVVLIHSLTVFTQDKIVDRIKFIDFYYENASPLIWESVGDTAIKINFLYDYERNSINRQSTHFNFKIIAEPGTDLNLILSGFRDIYNFNESKRYGRENQPITCYFSEDYKNWKPVKTNRVAGNNFDLQVKFKMKTDSVFIAKLPVYSLSRLEEFIAKIMLEPMVKIFPIGETVEKRQLEIIRLGNPTAKKSVLIRARAHAWEPGGNWAIEGLVDDYLSRTQSSDFANKICFYILPMANKDMVVRGMTRFNVNGMDLNRGWGLPSNQTLAPENYHLEEFLKTLIAHGNKPSFFIDFHNDNYGNLHVPLAKQGDHDFDKQINHFFSLLNERTWFSSKIQRSIPEAPDRFNSATGLYQRYDIPGIIFEFNGDRIEKLDKMPEIEDWKKMGAKLNEVFEAYFFE